MGRETFPVPNKREIRLKKKRGKKRKERSTIRPITFGEPRDNYRWVSVFSRCASRRLKNLHKHISSPRGLATRRRNKWGRHVSGYSLFAGKHLPGFSELPRQKGRQKDGKDLACQPRGPGQRKCKPHSSHRYNAPVRRRAAAKRDASPDAGPDKNVANHGGYLSRWCAGLARRAATRNNSGVMREPEPFFVSNARYPSNVNLEMRDKMHECGCVFVRTFVSYDNDNVWFIA